MKRSLYLLVLVVLTMYACSISNDKIIHEPNEIIISNVGTFNITHVSLITYCDTDKIPQYFGLYFSTHPLDQSDKATTSVEIFVDKTLKNGEQLTTQHFYYPADDEDSKILGINVVCRNKVEEKQMSVLIEGILSVVKISTKYLFEFELEMENDIQIEASCDIGVQNGGTRIVSERLMRNK